MVAMWELAIYIDCENAFIGQGVSVLLFLGGYSRLKIKEINDWIMVAMN